MQFESVSSSLRVLCLVTDAFGCLGGIAQYNRDLIEAFGTQPCMVQVLSLNKIDRTHGHDKLALADSNGNRIRFVLDAILATLRFRPHVVFCGHLNLAQLAAQAANLAGARLWLQIHGIDAWQPPSFWRHRGAIRADLVTAVSRFTKRQFLSWAELSPDRVRVLPNTVSERFYPGPRDPSFKEQFGFQKCSGPLLLTVARLTRGDQYKGIDDILAALRTLQHEFPSIAYLIAGDGDDRARLQDKAESLGVADHVHFLGRVADSMLPQLYREADLFVMPSRKEGFGIVYVEAMASGTPALGLDQDGSIDALHEGGLGYVATSDSLEATLLEALRTPFDRDHLAAQTTAVFGRPLFQRHVGILLQTLAQCSPESESVHAG